jgi:excisionase family DNA binding protein
VTAPLPDLLTLGEAATALRMSKASFRRRLDRGEFAVIRDRRHILIPRTTIHDYLERHTRQPRQTTQLVVAPTLRPARRTPQPVAPLRTRRVRHLWDGDAA